MGEGDFPAKNRREEHRSKTGNSRADEADCYRVDGKNPHCKGHLCPQFTCSYPETATQKDQDRTRDDVSLVVLHNSIMRFRHPLDVH